MADPASHYTGAAPVFARVHAWETLLLAWDRVEENSGGPGVDGVSLDDFELGLDEHQQTLQRDLRDHIYRPQPLLCGGPRAEAARARDVKRYGQSGDSERRSEGKSG